MRSVRAPSWRSRPRGPGDLEAHEENRGLRVRKPAAEVVQDAPARRHAARSDDDGGTAHVVDGPGLLHGARQLEPCRVKRAGPREHGLRSVRVEVLGVGTIEAGRLDRHRAVHEGRQLRDAAGILERAEVVDQLLGPTDGEGRHHEGGAAGHRRLDDALDLVGHGRRVVQPVAVGRLHEHVVGLPEGLRVEEDGRPVAADVPREHEPAGSAVPLQGERDGRRAEDVSRPPERRLRRPVGAGPACGSRGPPPLGRPRALLRRVERQRGRVLRRPASVVVRGVLFLEVAGVRKHDSREVRGPSRRGDSPPEAVLDEPGQVADMVDVGVGQRDGVDPRGVDGQRIPVPEAQVLQSLVEPAVDEEPASVHLDQELRAGDRPRRAQAVDRRDRRTRRNRRSPSRLQQVADGPAIPEPSRSLCRSRRRVKLRLASACCRPGRGRDEALTGRPGAVR